VELNKICFTIFRFFYELLRIYQFSVDLKNKRKINWRFYIGNPRKNLFYVKSIGKHLQQKKCTKICDIFCLLHESTYVELNKICFIIFRFFYELLCIYQFSADLKNKRKVN